MKEPAFGRLLKDATRRKFDVIMAWSVLVHQRDPARQCRAEPMSAAVYPPNLPPPHLTLTKRL